MTGRPPGPPSADAVPAVSVGLAVRNAPLEARRCIESVLAQDLGDLELVVCDNASDDGTVETLHEYARADRRVRVFANEVNVGSHENMNRVLDLSRGALFRWISADDWIEPGALAAGAQALGLRDDAVGVTSGFTIHAPGAPPRSETYGGEFPDSPDPARRFERMLWFFHAGDAKYDPIYGIYRRSSLMRTGRLRPCERTDWLLSAELALNGPIVHLDERFAHRTRSYPVGVDRSAFRRRLDPVHAEDLKTSPGALRRDLYSLALAGNLSEGQLQRCRRALRRFWTRELRRTTRTRVSDTVHGLAGSRGS